MSAMIGTTGAGESRVCHFCGATFRGPAFARAAQRYCCEGCFLRERESTVMHDITDQAMRTLAEALVAALDLREHETGQHSRRVACHTLVLARRFTQDAEALRQIYWGALLHDIGKIGIPDAILLKHGSLDDTEWQTMREHPEQGYMILREMPFLANAAEIVRAHEERFDGSGYPQGLRGAAIPWGARLFAVIDTLDAITTDRPYRAAQSFDAACREICAGAGTQFDPQAIVAFDAEEPVLREMVALKCGEARLPETLSNTLFPTKEVVMTRDPVCGMQIDEQKAAARAEHQGATYYFCSSTCNQKFLADPSKYSSTGHDGQHSDHARKPKR